MTQIGQDSEGIDSSRRPECPRRPSHDLFECLEQRKHKRFTEAEAKYIFSQIVDAVDYLHGIGIVHCDMKDENIVIDRNLKVLFVFLSTYSSNIL